MMAQRYNRGGAIGGAILIGLGLLFLAAQFFNFEVWQVAWPFFVIAIGAVFFVGMVAGGKSVSGLAIPGSIICTVGLILLVQDLTGYYTSWAYAWTVILMAVGVGLWIAGAWGGNPSEQRSGLRVLEIGFIMFVLFGAFFELLIFRTNAWGLGQIGFPALLILTGLYLLVRRSGLLGGSAGGPQGPSSDQPRN